MVLTDAQLAHAVQAARYANVAAALAVQGFGAVAPLPYPEAVDARLKAMHQENSGQYIMRA